MQIEEIARLAHEVNAAYCRSLGDNSQPPGKRLRIGKKIRRSMAINGVQFRLDNPHSTPEDSHNNWLKQKTEEGWRYGEVKDPDAKTHPCFCPYADLPQAQRTKDYLFQGVVDALNPATKQAIK